MQYLYVDTADMDNRIDNLNRAMKNPISDGEYVLGKLSRLGHPVFSGTGYYSTVNTNINDAINLCERAKRLIGMIGVAGECYEECEKLMKKFFDEFDLYSVALENEIRADLGLDSINTVDGQKIENVAKVVIGVAVITIGAVCTVATGGSLAAFMIPAVIGAGSGTIAGGVEAYINGESVVDGMADGFLTGSISGTVSGVVNVGVAANGVKGAAKFFVETGGDVFSTVLETGAEVWSGDYVTANDLLENIGSALLCSVIGEYADVSSKEIVSDYGIRTITDTVERRVSSVMNYKVKIPNGAVDGFIKFSRTTAKVTIKTSMKSAFVDGGNSSNVSTVSAYTDAYLTSVAEYYLLP